MVILFKRSGAGSFCWSCQSAEELDNTNGCMALTGWPGKLCFGMEALSWMWWNLASICTDPHNKNPEPSLIRSGAIVKIAGSCSMCHLTGWHALATRKVKSYFRVWFGNMTNIWQIFLQQPSMFYLFSQQFDMKVSHLALKNMTFMHFFSMHWHFRERCALKNHSRRQENKTAHGYSPSVSLWVSSRQYSLPVH